MATTPSDLADRAEFLLAHCQDWGSRSRASVLVLRELQQLMPEIVAQYRAHWQSRWDGGVPYRGR